MKRALYNDAGGLWENTQVPRVEESTYPHCSSLSSHFRSSSSKFVASSYHRLSADSFSSSTVPAIIRPVVNAFFDHYQSQRCSSAANTVKRQTEIFLSTCDQDRYKHTLTRTPLTGHHKKNNTMQGKNQSIRQTGRKVYNTVRSEMKQ